MKTELAGVVDMARIGSASILRICGIEISMTPFPPRDVGLSSLDTVCAIVTIRYSDCFAKGDKEAGIVQVLHWSIIRILDLDCIKCDGIRLVGHV